MKLRRDRFDLFPSSMIDTVSAFRSVSTKPGQAHLQVHPAKEWPTIKRLLVRKHRDFRLDAHFIAAMGVQPSGGKAYVTAIGVCPDPRCCGPQAEA